MAIPLAIQDFELRVQTALGGDEMTLPSEIISLPEYRGRAEFWAQRQTIYGNLKEPEKALYESAVIYETALLLLPYYQMQVVKTQQSSHGKIERFEINWEALSAQLTARRDESMEQIRAEDTLKGTGFSYFSVTNRR